MTAPTTTLVTGATRGIGRAIVELLVAQGQPVVGMARRPDPTFPAPLVCADLGDATAAAQALAEVAERWPVARLVNNAGVNQLQPLGAITDAAIAQVFDLNCRAAVQCTQAVLPGIRAARDAEGRPAGRIVNISSRSLLGRLDGSVYAAAKAGRWWASRGRGRWSWHARA